MLLCTVVLVLSVTTHCTTDNLLLPVTLCNGATLLFTAVWAFSVALHRIVAVVFYGAFCDFKPIYLYYGLIYPT